VHTHIMTVNSRTWFKVLIRMRLVVLRPEIFKAGDIADLDGEVAHQPVVDTDQPCIALIASESPVKFNGLFGKIMQPIVGI